MDAVAAAKARAMHNLKHCVVANTDDMPASAEMIEYVLLLPSAMMLRYPWLSKVDNLLHDSIMAWCQHDSQVLPPLADEGAGCWGGAAPEYA
jgi:hypothetical protein